MVNSNLQGPTLIRPVKTTFDPTTGIILAQVGLTDFRYLQQEIIYQGKVFSPKDELHITVVGGEDARDVVRYLHHKPGDQNAIEEILDETDFSFRKIGERYYVQERPGIETIIQMVEIPQIHTFYRSLSNLLGHGLILPPLHITLYTRGTHQSIGLTNQQQFAERVKTRIWPGELHSKGGNNSEGEIHD